ncbi:hypothetical protein ACK3YJ_09765 [Aeromonas caviae]
MAGVWKRDGTVAVTNGNKKVTGTGTTFADTKNGVAKGHLFCITSGTSVDFYEVDYVVSNTELYLVQAYRGVTATGKAYEIITTFSDSVPEFARRLTATLSAYQQQSDAFQALLTSTATTVEVTAPDGTKQTLIPWKRVTSEGEGQAARAKTEADKAAASAALAGDIVAASALPLPDVWAPLSDSLRLITGYGRDVLVGSDVVARMVNFSRNSTATYIGKDGQLKTAAANEPRFEKEGLLIEGQSTNLFPWSQQFIGKWDRVNGTANADPLFPNAIALNNSVNGFVNTSIGNIAVDGTYTITAIVTGYVDGVTELSAYFASQWQGSYKVIGKFGQYTIVSFTKPVTASSNTSNTGIGWAAGKAAGVVLCAMQVEALPFASSYIPTNGAAVTRAADVVNIPRLQNMGGALPTGLTVAITFNKIGFDSSFSNYILSLIDITNADRYGISTANSMAEVYSFDGYSNGFSGDVTKVRSAPLVLCLGIEGTRGFGINGTYTKRASGDPTPRSVTAGNIQLGSRVAGSQAWGHVRNFRMWRKELTAEQIRAIA